MDKAFTYMQRMMKSSTIIGYAYAIVPVFTEIVVNIILMSFKFEFF